MTVLSDIFHRSEHPRVVVADLPCRMSVRDILLFFDDIAQQAGDAPLHCLVDMRCIGNLPNLLDLATLPITPPPPNVTLVLVGGCGRTRLAFKTLLALHNITYDLVRNRHDVIALLQH